MEEEDIFHQKILAAVGTTGVCRKMWLSDRLSVLLCAHLNRVKIRSIQIWQKNSKSVSFGVAFTLHIHINMYIYIYIHTYMYTHMQMY